MLAEKRGRTVALPATGNVEKVDCAVQTTSNGGPCQDKGCLREKDAQSQEIKDLKRRVRDLKKRYNEKERELESHKTQQALTTAEHPPLVAQPPTNPRPPPNITPKPPKEQPTDMSLLAKVEDLEKENNRLKSSLHHAYERSNQINTLEMEKSKLS